jgi:uncharacterized protein YbbC (DUF1343 family)
VAAPDGESKTLTGIDILIRDDFRPLQGRRVGLITNQTGVDRTGISTAERLHRAEGVQLRALFSPEHGLQGKLDAKVDDTQDALTGLPVYSLYGENRTPTAASLEGLDTLVFDIQDIGARFYTYISTMGNAMRSAAEHQLRFVVLDRPNPINGVEVEGPILDDGSQSFVGFHTLPVRHGMTVGELAAMFNDELQLGVDLQVIPVESWRREDYFDRTGLLWVNPSPNMRSLAQAVLYPGIGLLETTNLSVGRGTDTPFEVIGAPWLDGIPLARALNQSGLAGVRFVPIRFTPDASKFAGQPCGGSTAAAFTPCGRDWRSPGTCTGCILRTGNQNDSMACWPTAARWRPYWPTKPSRRCRRIGPLNCRSSCSAAAGSCGIDVRCPISQPAPRPRCRPVCRPLAIGMLA